MAPLASLCMVAVALSFKQVSSTPILTDDFCLSNDEIPEPRLGCVWEPITFPSRPDCVVNYQCQPGPPIPGQGEAPDSPSGVRCPMVLKPSWSMPNCDLVADLDDNGCVITYKHKCLVTANKLTGMEGEVALRYRQYYLGPYARPAYMYPLGQRPGMKNGFGTRFYPKEWQWTVRDYDN